MKLSGSYSRDHSIYRDIAIRYYKEIFNYCYVKLMYNREDAEECTQEVFMILLLKWKTISSTENIRAWLYRTSDNVMRNFRKKAYRHKRELGIFDNLQENQKLIHEDDYGSFELLYILSMEEQRLLKEYYLDKATAKELSNKYKVSENVIYVKIYRIKVKLRKILESENNV